MKCPNQNSEEFKLLIEKFGKVGAYRAWMENGEEMPTIEQINSNEFYDKVDSKISVDSMVSNLKREGLIHNEPNKYGSYFVRKGRIGEDTGQDKSNYTLNLDKLESYNKYSQSIINMDILDIRKIGNATVVNINAMAVELINAKRNYSQLIDSGSNAKVDQKLNETIKSWLSSKGISVVAVEELFTRTGNNAKAVADILNKVVKIVNNKISKDTLPEEAGHFFAELIGENSPLYKRLYSLASQSSLLDVVKTKYAFEYSTEKDYIKETIGQLIGNAITDKWENTEKPSLVSQLIATVKLILARVKSILGIASEKDLQKIIDDAYGIPANAILQDTLAQDEYLNKDLKDINTNYYALEDDLLKFKSHVTKAINRLKQKAANYKQTHKVDEYNESLQHTLEELQQNQNIEGYTAFIKQAKFDINLVYMTYVKMLKTEKKIPLARLRHLRNYVSSYDLLDEFLSMKFEDPKYRVLKDSITNSNKTDTGEYVESTMNQLKEIKQIFKDHSRIEIANFLYEFGKSNPNLTPEIIENQLKFAEDDISVAKAYLDAMGDQKDLVLSLTHKVLRSKKDSARVQTVDAINRLISLTEKYEKETGKKGLHIFNNFYEKDSDGKVTGNYKSELDSQFWRDKEVERQRLLKVFEGDLEKAKSQLKKWHRITIKNAKYKKQFNDLKKDIKAFELFTEYMKIYDEAKDMLHYDKMYTRLPMVHKDLVSRVLTDWKHAGNILKQELKSTFTTREDENQYGLLDEAGKPINTVPIYYTRPLENMQDLSTDIVSSLSMFYKMAANYKEMSSIQAEMETIKELVGERDVPKTKFYKPLINPTTGEPVVTKGLESNSYKMLEDTLKMQLYGQMKSTGQIVHILGTDIDLSKVGDFLDRYTAANTLIGNMFSAVSNITVGKTYRIAEALAGQFYDTKDAAWAEKTYFTNLPSFMAEDIGSRRPITKLGVFIQRMDALQKFNEDIHDIKGFQRNRLYNILGIHLGFIGLGAGEHYMQLTSFLSIGRKWKLTNGKIVNMFEDGKVVDGKWIYDDKDITKAEITRYTDMSKRVNQFMDGIYNDDDKSIMQRSVLGRMAIMLRKHLVPGLNRRFKGIAESVQGKAPMYNYGLESFEEGTYVTFGKHVPKIVWGLMKDLKDLQFKSIAGWSNLSEWEKANIIRATTELVFMIALAALASAFKDWEKDKKINQFALYEINRTYTELRSYSSLGDAMKILKSPAAAVTSLQSIGGLLGMLSQPWNWNDRYTRGKRAGELKIGAKFTDLVPIVSKFDNYSDISRQIDYLK